MLTIILLIEAVSLYYVVNTVHVTFHALSHSISQQFYGLCVTDILCILEMRIPGI